MITLLPVPAMLEPAATLAAAGTTAFLKVTVLPLTVRVAPSLIKELSEVELVPRFAVTEAVPEPVAVVRPRLFKISAVAEIFRSPPVDVVNVILPPVMAAAVLPVGVLRVAAPAATTAFWAPLAMSIAFRRSPTVAVELAAVVPV